MFPPPLWLRQCLSGPAEGRIEFDNVDFTYPSERQKQVLHGLTFTVEPQTKVSLTIAPCTAIGTAGTHVPPLPADTVGS